MTATATPWTHPAMNPVFKLYEVYWFDEVAQVVGGFQTGRDAEAYALELIHRGFRPSIKGVGRPS